MKSALIVSLSFHLLVTVAWMRIVRIVPVRFVPRQVYSVQLLTIDEVDKALKKEKPKPPVVEPPEPEPQEQKKEELVPPDEKKPKPKPKPRPPDKVIPSTRITEAPDTAMADSIAIAETGDMVLDVEEFPFAYYLMTIKRKIASLWSAPKVGGGGPIGCRIYFRVRRGGAIEGTAIENSSGNYLFDQTALRAVVNASPLPPLPDGFKDNYLGVHFSFVLEEQ